MRSSSEVSHGTTAVKPGDDTGDAGWADRLGDDSFEKR
jgi:hypothetical protein